MCSELGLGEKQNDAKKMGQFCAVKKKYLIYLSIGKWFL